MTAILREERIGGQRLILGDCLHVMPTLGRFAKEERDYWLDEENSRLTSVAAHLGYDLVKRDD